MSWQEEAQDLKFGKGKSWMETARNVAHYFPDLSLHDVWEKVRSALRNTDTYKTRGKVTFEDKREPTAENVDTYLQQLITLNDTIMQLETKQNKATLCIDESKPIGLAFWGDWHVGGKGINYRQLDADADTIAQTDGLYVIGMGDYKDNGSALVHPTSTQDTIATTDMQDKIIMRLFERTKERHIVTIRGCFLDGAQITMADGTRKNIENIIAGDSILSGNGNVRAVLKKHDNWYSGEVIEFETTGSIGSTKATADHKVLAIKKSEIVCKYRERVCKPNSPDKAWCKVHKCNGVRALPQWHQVGELSVGDFLMMPKSELHSTTDADKAYLFGLFLAEGNYENKMCGICYTFSADEEKLALHIKQLLFKCFGVNASIVLRKAKNTISVRAYGNELADLFFDMCGEYSHSKVIAKSLMKSEQSIHVLAGMLDGDGHQRPLQGDMTITTISKQLAFQLQQILINHGIVNTLRKQYRKNRNYDDYQINISGTLANKIPSRNGKATPKAIAHVPQYQFDNGDYIAVPIRKMIRSEYAGRTHDFEVDRDHSYIVNGIAAHNCHDDWDKRNANKDFVQTLCDITGAVNLWHGGIINLTVGDQEYRIGARHKYKFESSLNTTNTQRNFTNEFGVCDVVAVAHKHFCEVYDLHKQGQETVYLRSGAYKAYDEYGQKLAGYEGMYGIPIVILLPDKHLVLPFKDFDAGLDMLKTLRQ